jgi:hypothetical protein
MHRVRNKLRRAATSTTLALAVLVLATVAAPGSASAHERRTVAGKYVFVVGFLTEPAYVEEANGVDIVVTTAQGNKPVEGLEKTLKVEVSAGGTSKSFDVHVVFNRDGAYKAEFIPTRTGTYAFRFIGTVEGTPVDERFESGPGRFDDVVSKAPAQFPAAVPSNAELAAQLQSHQPSQVQPTPQGTLSPSSAAPAGGTAAGVSSEDLRRALDRANSARTRATLLGGAGLAVGVLGTVLALVALLARPRRHETVERRRSPSEPI